MATYSKSNNQSTNEIVTYTIDFTADIPTGGSITGGTATHIPPSGSGTTIVCTASSPYVYVTVPAISLTGVHYVDVKGTASDADTPVVRLEINVLYPSTAARASMASLVGLLRSYTAAIPNDYTVAGVPYWTDAQLQTVLDRHVIRVNYEMLTPLETTGSAGSISYYDYQSRYRFYESTVAGTSRFIVQDETGGTIGTAAWTADYPRGMVTFGTTTDGYSRYLSGYAYDINAAAADIWAQKASHYVTAYDFSTDNHSLSRGQIIKNCMMMAKEYGSGGRMISVTVERGDTEA